MLNALGLTKSELIQMEYPLLKKTEDLLENSYEINYFINAELP